MKVGLFFVCGRNFIILPQKSVPSLLTSMQKLQAKLTKFSTLVLRKFATLEDEINFGNSA